MATLPIFVVHIQADRRCPYVQGRRTRDYPRFPTTIGEHVRKRRLDLKLRQIDAAMIIGCDELTVVNWEKGHTQPSVNRMAGVVKFLGFNPLPNGDSLAQTLVNHRKALGVTQSHFAARIGVDPGTLGRWERGEREPDKIQLRKLGLAGFGEVHASG